MNFIRGDSKFEVADRKRPLVLDAPHGNNLAVVNQETVDIDNLYNHMMNHLILYMILLYDLCKYINHMKCLLRDH